MAADTSPRPEGVAETAERVRSGAMSAHALVQATLERVEQVDPTIRAFITVDAEGAMEAARRADRALEEKRSIGPLHGVPFAVKDQIRVERLPLTGGSAVQARWLDDVEATVVRRLRAAGAILVGTLNTMEFHIGTNRSYAYGTPRNPWDVRRTPGGSSSGSAAAVAAGLVPFTLGGDTGGSIRTPSALCGVTGLRGTWSRVSRHGVIPLSTHHDAIGPIARTVTDAVRVFGVIAGHDDRDPTTSRRPVPDLEGALSQGIDGLRVGVLRETTDAPEVLPEARRAVTDACEVLASLGAIVEDVSVPLVAHSRAMHAPLVYAEACTHHRRHLREQYDAYDVNTRTSLLAGAVLPASMVAMAQRARAALTHQFVDAFGRFDVLVGPTTRGGAPFVPEAHPVTDPRDARHVYYGGGGHAAGQHTRAFAMAGVPALTVCAGFDADGLPLGLHLAGAWFDEAAIVRAGHAFQSVTRWHRARPRLASDAGREHAPTSGGSHHGDV